MQTPIYAALSAHIKRPSEVFERFAPYFATCAAQHHNNDSPPIMRRTGNQTFASQISVPCFHALNPGMSCQQTIGGSNDTNGTIIPAEFVGRNINHASNGFVIVGIAGG
jgi:hypothetical protein